MYIFFEYASKVGNYLDGLLCKEESNRTALSSTSCQPWILKKEEFKRDIYARKIDLFCFVFWCWCRCYKCLNMNFFLWSRKNNHLPAKNKLQSAVKIIMIMIIWIGCIHTYSCQDRHRAKIRKFFRRLIKR